MLATSWSVPAAESKLELTDVRKIWDAGAHNAFTDLVRHQGQWFCVFREGQGHVSPDGSIRVLASAGGKAWPSAALLKSTEGDLRDPKITVAPGGQLMLYAAVALQPPGPVKHRSLVWFSDDGKSWGDPVIIGDPNQWLWRVAWHRGQAYSVGYDTAGEKFIRFYASKDGRKFETLVPNLFDQEYPNETGLVFLPDDTLLCLLRRDGKPGRGLLGSARPPYTQWDWKDIGVRIGGPQMIRLPDGRLLAAVRLYDGKVRTSLGWIDANSGKFTEALALPSGGDTSYAGMVLHEGQLWLSYYSSHEGKTSIYLARVGLPAR